MPAPYGIDLRERVSKACKNSGKKLKEIAKDFTVSTRTIDRWLKQEAEEGHVKPKTGYQKGHSHIIKDNQELVTLLEENNFSTIGEIAKALGKGSYMTISRALKRLNYVKKKEKNPTKNKI
jgi:transposase